MTTRFHYLDALKGLAILLMVMGHVLSSFFPNPYLVYATEPRSVMLLHRFIYSFHMPLLMFLSGYVTLRLNDYSLRNCVSTLWRRFRTLVIPFFTVGLLRYVFFPEYCLDYWFIWILFQFILLTLCVEYVCSLLPKYSSNVSMVVISLIALFLQYYNRVLYYYDHLPFIDVSHWALYIFFVAGIACAKYEVLDRLLDNNMIYTLAVVIFIGLTLLVTIFGKQLPLWSKWNCALPFSAIVMLMYIFRNALNQRRIYFKYLDYIGQNSLAVYLFHFFFIPSMYSIGELFVGSNAIFNGEETVFVQLIVALIMSIIIIILTLVITKVIAQSSLLSFLLLGKKYETCKKNS